jgi:hypothetical protein
MNATANMPAVSPAATQFLCLGEKDFLVKFTFGNERYLPKGLPMVARPSDKTMDEIHAQEKYLDEDDTSAEIGRHRAGRVDTGVPVIENLQLTSALFLSKDIETNGFKLVSVHYYLKEAKGKFGKPAYVIVFHYSKYGTAMPLSPELEDALLAFFEGAVWTAHVWNNPSTNPTTINFVQPSPGIGPKHEMVIEKGVLRFVTYRG